MQLLRCMAHPLCCAFAALLSACEFPGDISDSSTAARAEPAAILVASGSADPNRYGLTAPAIARDAAGNFIVAWGHTRTYAAEPCYWGRLYTADGAPRAPEFAFSEDASCDASEPPSVAMNASGEFVVGWREIDDMRWTLKLRRFGADGQPRGEVQRVPDLLAAGSGVAVALNAGGDYAVAWTADAYTGAGAFFIGFQHVGAVTALRYRADGSQQGSQLLAAGITGFDGPTNQRAAFAGGPMLALADDGTLTVGWHRGSVFDPINPLPRFGLRRYAGAYDSVGLALPLSAPLQTVNRTAELYDLVIDHAGQHWLAWSNYEEPRIGETLYLRRYSPFGLPLGEPMLVAEIPHFVSPDAGVRLAALADGGVAVLWVEAAQNSLEIAPVLHQRYYATDGSLRGESLQPVNRSVIAGVAGVQGTDGRLILAWSETFSYAEQDQLYLRLLPAP